MKELEIVKDTFTGVEPDESRSLTFRILETKKVHTFNFITHGDYIYFRKLFDPEEATGWKGYNFLKNKYQEDKPSENTPEEDARISDGFKEMRKKFK